MSIGIIAILLGIAACRQSVRPENANGSRLKVIAAVFFAVGTLLTQMPPYVMTAGLIALVSSSVRFLDEAASKTLFRTGYLSVSAAILIAVVGLFQSPLQIPIDIEDRTDWSPPVVTEKTPRELLAVEWSTYDQNCNWPAANLLLKLCDIAYDAPVDARDKIKAMGFGSESINAGSMQGYVVDAGGDSIVVLRGTERHEYDILQDLRFLKVRTEQGAMHGGFVTGYNPMHGQVTRLLDRYGTKRVWITGHSLGGGLAIVCAHRILVDGRYPIAGVMTFGQPKVCREDMASYLAPRLDGKYVFFVNDMDPVTRLISPYLHFGHMVRWTGDNIERSRHSLVFGSSEHGPFAPQAGIEEGYVDGITDKEFVELLDKAEDAAVPKYDQDGNPIYEGFVPNVYHHFLSSYDYMMEQLQTHSSIR